MYLQKIESKGLAHYSYLIGDGKEAAVIDPRRDAKVYLDLAREAGLQIKYIFETHRNEDYIIGSMELADITKATIHISGYEDLGYVYGKEIFDGEEFQIGSLKLKALHTPGHTLGHLSYVVYMEDKEMPYCVFTGDSIFMGDLGRTDFYGEENLEKMTGLMYDSIFEKLLPLGDGVLAFPAHGAGSACGEDMEDRPYTTLGYERLANPKLQVSSKEEFIQKAGSMRIKPRYFEKMEVFNTKGAPFVGTEINLPSLELDKVLEEGYVILDCRTKEAFVGGHIPGSYFLNSDNISTYLGSLFELDSPIVLNLDSVDIETLDELFFQCQRIGFDNLKGYLDCGVDQLINGGKVPEKFPTIDPEEFLKLEGDFILVDVRKPDEVNEEKSYKNRINIPLQKLYKEFPKLDKDKKVYVLCASGNRATAGAVFLKHMGYDTVIISGGISVLESLN